jgi:hemerythrin
MTQITWEERFNTGIEVIDFQHKKIVDMLNDLHRASIKSETDAASEILKRMREYVTEHFSFEEELLRAANYQFTEAHIKLHQRYIERLDNLSQRHHAGESVAKEMSQFLTQWLVHHIGHEDQDYVDDVKVIMKDICQ